MKRFTSSLILIAMFLAATAAPALAKKSEVEEAIDDGDAGVRLVSEDVAAVTRGDDVWIMLNWTAFGDVIDGVDDFQVRLRKDPPGGVVVDYPSNTRDHTSLWDNDVLMVGEVDYTALNLVVDGAFSKDVIKLDLNVSFSVDGEDFREKVKINVPVVTFDGDPLEQVTHDWGSATIGDAGWYEIAFAGGAPAVTDFSVVISEPGGVVLTYPQGDFTSLHFDDVLEARETDVVRIYVETLDMTAGTHEFEVKCTYTYEGERHAESDTLTLTITAP